MDRSLSIATGFDRSLCPAVFKRYGFEMIHSEIWERTDLTGERRNRLVEPFRSMSREDLEVLRGIFVWRRNSQVAGNRRLVTQEKKETERTESIPANTLNSSKHTNARLKIALLSYEYPPETGFGGIGTYTWYQARALAKLGHEVHVLSGATDPTLLRSR